MSCISCCFFEMSAASEGWIKTNEQTQLHSHTETAQDCAIVGSSFRHLLCVSLNWFLCLQAKENSSLRETLAAYRGAAEAELQALRATVQKLESQKQEKPPPPISDKEVDDRKRAEEKTAQEILCLKHVSPPNSNFSVFVRWSVTDSGDIRRWKFCKERRSRSPLRRKICLLACFSSNKHKQVGLNFTAVWLCLCLICFLCVKSVCSRP